MPMIRTTVLASFLTFSVGAWAQPALQYDGTVPVTRGSTTLDLAWFGGVNFSQIGQLDLDQDGLKDLVFFDKTGNKISTLRNTGGTGTGRYALTRAYDNVWPFPELHDWALFHDYDCDGKEDIFSHSSAGFSVYRNTSSNGTLSFEMLTYRVNCDFVFTDGTSQRTNLYVSSDDLPGLADVDGDGDLDVLTFSQLGTYVEYYKNLSMETIGTCDSLMLERRNVCWGRFAENSSTNAITLNVDCQFQVPSPEIGGEPQTGSSMAEADREAAHAGSTVIPIDLNGDGVKDLLLGDIAYANLVALTNGGTVNNSLMTEVDHTFPSDDTPVNLPVFPAAYHIDVNGDGKRDLLVCPNARGLGQNYKSVWYYLNTGTDIHPDFEFQQEDLFQSRMVDVGEGANPVPFDHNGDGLMDLIISNEGYYHPTGNYVGKLALFENTGTTTQPAFHMVTDDYMNLSASGIGTSMFPAFADLDGDGDQDMYIGDLQGRFHFYRNTATGPIAQFTLAQANVPLQDGTVLDLGRQVTPQFIDLDRDGLIDMVAGEQNGNLNYVRNVGTTNAPVWNLQTDSLGRVRTVTTYTLGHSAPFIYENTAGEYELIVGSEAGTLWHYTGIEGNLSGTWTLTDSIVMDIHEGYRSTLCMYDYTGDGALDMVVGNYRGGVTFWRSDAPSSVRSRWATAPALEVHPNPNDGHMQVRLPNDPAPGTLLILRNALGQELQRYPIRSQFLDLDLSGNAPGMYLLHLQSEGQPHQPVRVVVR